MTTRPTTDVEWATDDDYASGAEVGETTKADPSGLRAQGILPNQRIPARFFNFLFGSVGQWILYLTQKTDGVFSPMNFGAVGEIVTELEDDTAALQDCFDAAKAAIDGAAGGGAVTIDLGGRQYRITGMLQDISPHVNVKNGKLVMYHASANALEFSVASSIRTAGVWENVEIGYAEANSGIIIYNNAAVCRVAFRNCRFNDSGFCTGRLFYSPPASDFWFDEECRGVIPINNPGFRSDAGLLHLRGRWSTKAGYADTIVSGTGGVHDIAAHFDTTLTVGGTATCIQMGGQTLIAVGCHFDDGSGNGNHAIQINDGGIATIKCNKYTGIIPFVDDTNTLGLGSDVDLIPHTNTSLSGSGFTIPRYYASYEVYSSHTDAPTATLKVPLFLGQELEVAVRNVEGDDPWASSVGFTSSIPVAYSEDGLTTLTDDEIATIRFRAMRLGVSDKAWVQIGAAAQHFVV